MRAPLWGENRTATFVLRIPHKPTLFVRKHFPFVPVLHRRTSKFIFIKLEKKSLNTILPEPRRRSQPASSWLTTDGSTGLRKVWVSRAPLSAAASERHSRWWRSIAGAAETASVRTAFTQLANFFFALVPRQKITYFGLFFPKNFKRMDCTCFWMNVMVCSWTRQTNTTCLDLGLVLMPLQGGFPFTLLTHWTEIDAFCVYSEMTDVPLCNVQSLFESKTFNSRFHSWGATTWPFVLKVGIERR